MSQSADFDTENVGRFKDGAGGGGGVKRIGRGQVCMLGITSFKQMASS